MLIIATKGNAKTKQSTREHKERIFHQQQRDLIDEYFHRPGDLRFIKTPFDRQGQLWADQKYYEYYEYLCNVIFFCTSIFILLLMCNNKM